jgi:hypothetical protein
VSDVFVYVDESVRSGRYVICCVHVEADRAGALRRRVRQLLLPGQRKLHFKKEGPRRRKELLRAFDALDVRAVAYICRMRQGRDESAARAMCLARAVRDIQSLGATAQLLLESRDHLDEGDRVTILRARSAGTVLSFEHLAPTGDPLLWLADGLAWPVSVGGEWRQRLPAGLEIVDIG